MSTNEQENAFLAHWISDRIGWFGSDARNVEREAYAEEREAERISGSANSCSASFRPRVSDLLAMSEWMLELCSKIILLDRQIDPARSEALARLLPQIKTLRDELFDLVYTVRGTSPDAATPPKR